MTEHHGPPKEVEGRTPHHQGRPSTSRFSGHDTAYTRGNRTAEVAKTARQELVWVPCTWSHPQDLHSQLERRRNASRRLPAVCDRCGARDPISCRCYDPQPPLTPRAVEAWRAAILRTLPIGPPVVPVEVLQRLYRNGGRDRQLAERVWAETGGLVA